MKIKYKSYEIEIVDDNHYCLMSADNKNKYVFEYSNGKPVTEIAYSVSKYGIRIKDLAKNIEYSSAILSEDGGTTTVHSESYYIEQDKIWICICDKIYCLGIPNLEIIWHKRLDWATHFSIHSFKDDFIIHGELAIFRICKTGHVKWEFGAREIFINIKEGNYFEIKDDIILVKDWEGDICKIDENGKEIKAL
jgi:hypothetical protein